MSYWRAVTKAIIAWSTIRKEVFKVKMDARDNRLNDFKDALRLYQDVTRSWLMKAMKTTLVSVSIKS